MFLASDFEKTFLGQLEEAERVKVNGLGSFQVRKYKSYFGRDPATGEEGEVPMKKLVFFKADNQLRSWLNTESGTPTSCTSPELQQRLVQATSLDNKKSANLIQSWCQEILSQLETSGYGIAGDLGIFIVRTYSSADGPTVGVTFRPSSKLKAQMAGESSATPIDSAKLQEILDRYPALGIATAEDVVAAAKRLDIKVDAGAQANDDMPRSLMILSEGADEVAGVSLAEPDDDERLASTGALQGPGFAIEPNGDYWSIIKPGDGLHRVFLAGADANPLYKEQIEDLPTVALWLTYHFLLHEIQQLGVEKVLQAEDARKVIAYLRSLGSLDHLPLSLPL